MSVWVVFAVLASVLLQFLDWYTTKIFVHYEGADTEANPLFGGSFEKNGVTSGLLYKKLVLGLFGGILAALPSSSSSSGFYAHDVLVGLIFLGGTYVVLNNFSGILIILYKLKTGLSLDIRDNQKPILALNTCVRSLMLTVIFVSVGIYLLVIYGRTFMFGLATATAMHSIFGFIAFIKFSRRNKNISA